MVVSAFGVPLATSMIAFKRYHPVSHFILHEDNIPYIVFGENDGDGSTVSAIIRHQGVP